MRSMGKFIILFLIVFYSCAVTKQISHNKVDNLYCEAFCTLMIAKHEFNTPNNVRRDTLFILDEYYMDTTSIYYNQKNFNFELCFVDTINFPHYKGDSEHWAEFQKFNAARNIKKHHNIKAECLDTMKLKFISERDVNSVTKKGRTFLYSPLIRIKENNYIIYEHDMAIQSDYYYAYMLKRVDNRFEFIKRRYYSDTFLAVKEDYMKTINFDQTYEGFINKKN